MAIDTTTKPPNPERTGLTAGTIILVLGALMLVGPTVAGMDMMAVGYGLSFIGLFITISGVVTWWIFHKRYTTWERMFQGDGLLVHWTYDPAETERQARQLYDEFRQRNRSLFWLVAGMMLVIGFIVLVIPMLLGDDLLWPVVALYFGLIPLIGWVAWLTPRRAYESARRWGGLALIARDGLYVGGALHTWNPPLSELKKVELELGQRGAVLQFYIRNLTRLGWVHYETMVAHVPVPAGQEPQAEEVARFFAGAR